MMLDDLKLAARRLRNAPGFTVVAILTLALAIGANTAIFSIADAVLFRPLPYADPERVFVVRMWNPQTAVRSSAVPSEYLEILREHHRGLAGIGFRGPTTMMSHVSGTQAEWLETFPVSLDYLKVLGIQAARGRSFETADTAVPGRAVMLSFEAWQSMFGGDEGLIGRTVRLGTRDRDIVGILPRGFVFPAESMRFAYNHTGRVDFVTISSKRSYGPGLSIDPVARLAPGVTREQAQSEMNSLLTSFRAGRSKDGAGVPVLDDPRLVLFPTGRPIMMLVAAAAGLVLLIGCANLANMLLARTRRRERELGVQAALGATRLRLVRPILLEAAVIGLIAAALALLVTALGFDLLLREVPPVAYGRARVGVDLRVGVFALGLGVLTGVLFAAVPAWSAAGLDVQSLLQRRRASTRRGMFGQRLLIAQVAVAIVLVFGAVVAARAFVSVLRVPLGFAPESAIAFNVVPEILDAAEWRGFYARASEMLGRRGDVVAAGAGHTVPLDGLSPETSVQHDNGEALIGVNSVLPGYFAALDIRLVAGRLPTWDDVRSGADVAVVTASAARILVPRADAIGQTFSTAKHRQFVIIGVVGDVRTSLDSEPYLGVYTVSRDSGAMTIVARVRAKRGGTLAELRRDVGTLSPKDPVTAVWLDDLLMDAAAYRNPRFQTLVLGSFATLALGLTALGVYGVVAFGVAARTREMGVRLALGAPPQSMERLFVREVLRPIMIGILLGIAATYWLERIAEFLSPEVNARDPLLLSATILTVAVAAVVAAYLPARRARHVDPIVVLRAE